MVKLTFPFYLIVKADLSQKKYFILNVVEQLPDVNQKVLMFMLNCFVEVNKHEKDNRMNFSALSTCFAPNVLRPTDPLEELKFIEHMQVFFKNMLEYKSLIFDAEE